MNLEKLKEEYQIIRAKYFLGHYIAKKEALRALKLKRLINKLEGK